MLRGKNAIFVDTKGDFYVERFQEMAIERLGAMGSKNSHEEVQEMLKRLFVIRLLSESDLWSTVFQLNKTLEKYGNVDLLVVDSFSFFLKKSIDNFDCATSESEPWERCQTIAQLTTELRVIAQERNLAVVVTNDCTTKIKKKVRIYCASLGDLFFSEVNDRFILSRNSGSTTFYINLEKSLLMPSRITKFTIDQAGVQ